MRRPMGHLLAGASFAAMCAITVSTTLESPFTGATAAGREAAATIDVYKDAG